MNNPDGLYEFMQRDFRNLGGYYPTEYSNVPQSGFAPISTPGFNAAGGMHDKLNGLAAALMAAGGNGQGAQAIMSGIRARQQPTVAELAEEMRKRGMPMSPPAGGNLLA